MKNSPANKVTVHKFTNIYFLRHPYSYSTVWIMKICYGVTAHITHFRFLPISPLIFATVQKFALDYLRDQQILTPPCEWGWVVVVPLLGTTLEVEDSPGMVWSSYFATATKFIISPFVHIQALRLQTKTGGKSLGFSFILSTVQLRIWTPSTTWPWYNWGGG